MGLPPGDYRASSYKRIARESAAKREEAAKKKAALQAQSSVGLKSEAVVKSEVAGVSQVAVRGKADSNVERRVVSKPVVAPPSALGQQAPVDTSRPVEDGGKVRVAISPGLYGALQRQKEGRLGEPGLYAAGRANYYAEVEKPSALDYQRQIAGQKLKTSIQTGQIREAEATPAQRDYFGWSNRLVAGSRSSFGKAYRSKSFFGSVGYASLGAAQAGGAVAVGVVEPAAYAVFTPKRERALVGTYSDIKGGYAPGLKVESQQRAGQFQLGMLAAGFTASSPPRDFLVTSRVASRQLVGERASVSVSKVYGDVSYTRGYFFPRKVSYSFKGVGKDVAVRTGRMGQVSGEPIYGTRSSLRLSFSQDGKVRYLGEVTGRGGEVAGLGSRRLQSVIRSPRLGVVRKRDGFVESYAGVEVGDITYGGSVGGRGVGFFTGRKLLEAPVTVKGRPTVKSGYIDETLGIRNLERGKPFVELVQRESPGTVRVFDIRSAGQREIPSSARLTGELIRGRLRTERPPKEISLGLDDITPGSVNPVAREQATGGLVSVQVAKQSYPVSGGLTVQKTVTRLATGIVPTRSPVLVPTLTPVTQFKTSKSSQVSVQSPFSTGRVRAGVVATPVVSQRGEIGQTAFVGLSQVFKPSVGLRRGSLARNVPSVIPGARAGTAQVPRVVPITRLSQAQTPRTITPRVPLVPQVPTPFTPPLIPPFRLDADLSGGWGLRSYKARRVTRYTPSFTALFYNIKGRYKAGRLSKSGLEFRPITKEFSILGRVKRFAI